MQKERFTEKIKKDVIVWMRSSFDVKSNFLLIVFGSKAEKANIEGQV